MNKDETMEPMEVLLQGILQLCDKHDAHDTLTALVWALAVLSTALNEQQDKQMGSEELVHFYAGVLRDAITSVKKNGPPPGISLSKRRIN